MDVAQIVNLINLYLRGTMVFHSNFKKLLAKNGKKLNLLVKQVSGSRMPGRVGDNEKPDEPEERFLA